MKLNYYPLRKNNKDNNVIITPLFHWLFTRGAGNNGEYFAAAWPGKIIAVIPSVGVKFLKLSKKFRKMPLCIAF